MNRNRQPRTSWRPRFMKDRCAQILTVTVVGSLYVIRRLLTREAVLRTSEERFELAVRGGDEGLWDWDLITADVYFSPRWKSVLGYEDHELPNRFEEWRKRLHPDDLALATQTIQDHLDGKTPYYELEHRLLHRDGAYRWIRARGVVARDASGRPYRLAGMHWDLTDRKRTEQELRRSRDELATAQRIAHIGSWSWDPDTNEERWSDETYRVLGYEPRSFNPTAQAFVDRVHPEDRQRVTQTVQEAWANHQSVTLEYRLLLPDGSERFIYGEGEVECDRSGRPVRMVGTTQDVTERKRAEERLREKDEQYRRVFHETSDGLVINTIDGGIAEVNPAMCRMHGYTYEEFLQLHPTQFIHPGYHHLFRDVIQTVKAGGDYRTRAIDIRKDGTQFHVEVRCTGFTHMGEPHVLAVIRDITEEVEAYELLEQRVRERTRELSALLEVSRNVNATLELEPLLGLILDGLQAVVEYRGAAIFTVQGEDFKIAQYRIPERAREVALVRPPLAEAYREVVRRRESVIISDMRGDTPLARAFQESIGDGLTTTFGHVRSWLGVPMMLQDRVIGGIGLSYDEPQYFTPRHAELAMAIANQAAIAIENARLYERAAEVAALEERQRLARELHDSVSQALYGIALGTRTARTLLDRDPSQLAEPLDYVLSLAEAGLAEMRALIFELRPESLETEGLVAAFEKQAASVRARHHIDVHLHECVEPDLPLELKEALYRIGQEAIHNTIKHARAGRIDLSLECGPEAVSLVVADNGIGFDPTGSFPGHLGLHSMRERALRLGGSLSINSRPGEGASLTATLPHNGAASR